MKGLPVIENPERLITYKAVLNMKTGKTLLSRARKYRGPIVEAMPNAHPTTVKSSAELQAGITPTNGSQLERIPWEWYHKQTYTDNTTTQLIFFQTSAGGLNTTNMQAGGQIPAPMYYDLYHIAVYFQLPDGAAAFTDLVGLLNSVSQFTIAQKQYWLGPTWNLPAGGGAFGTVDNGTVAAALEWAQNGIPDQRNRYSFWGDITIPHNQNFAFQMDWAAAVNTAANVDITVVLDGYLYRRVL
jgi:hypothetical protein